MAATRAGTGTLTGDAVSGDRTRTASSEVPAELALDGAAEAPDGEEGDDALPAASVLLGAAVGVVFGVVVGARSAADATDDAADPLRAVDPVVAACGAAVALEATGADGAAALLLAGAAAKGCRVTGAAVRVTGVAGLGAAAAPVDGADEDVGVGPVVGVEPPRVGPVPEVGAPVGVPVEPAV